MPAVSDPELDHRAVRAACERRVRAASPEHIGLARQLFDSVPPSQWLIEWDLPWWLGYSFGLERRVARELVISNVLGLAALKLEDDFVDGDIKAGDIPGATALMAVLYREALAVYRVWFDATSPLWPEFERQLAQWRAVRQELARGESGAYDGSRDLTWQRLAQQGAPSKISALAACLLAGRSDVFPLLDVCLDHGIAASVLYDNFTDWQDDLAAGRWNAFVASLSPGPQVPRRRRSNRDAVLEAMLTTDATRTYFARMAHEAQCAAALGEQLSLEPLAAYFHDFAVKAVEQGKRLHYHYRSQLDRAVILLFGGSSSGDHRRLSTRELPD